MIKIINENKTDEYKDLIKDYSNDKLLDTFEDKVRQNQRDGYGKHAEEVKILSAEILNRMN